MCDEQLAACDRTPAPDAWSVTAATVPPSSSCTTVRSFRVIPGVAAARRRGSWQSLFSKATLTPFSIC